jgi:hypothetical protein
MKRDRPSARRLRAHEVAVKAEARAAIAESGIPARRYPPETGSSGVSSSARSGPRQARAGQAPEWSRRDREIESLVLTVCALDPERAALLLEGLADPPRTVLLATLGLWRETSRAQRHAALESAFGARADASVAALEIPGVLGERVRTLLAPAGPPTGASRGGAIERWARRLALECVSLGKRGCQTIPPEASAGRVPAR